VVSDFLEQLGGSAGTVEDIFVSTELGFISAAVAAVGVALALRLVGAERSGLGEVVLSTPTSRLRWYAANVAVPLALTAFLLVVLGVVLGVVGPTVTELAPSLGESVGASLARLPAVWVLIAVAAALAGAVPRFAPFAWAVLLVTFLVGELGPSMQLPSWLLDASPFTHLSQLPGGTFEVVPSLALVAVTAVLVVLGGVAYRHRDVA
jgi:ABC-2 type transport system permease protein